jgi:TolB protein
LSSRGEPLNLTSLSAMKKTIQSTLGILAFLGVILLLPALRPDPPYQIAYASLAPFNTAVFIANADGSGERMLVGASQLDANASFSPDGQWVFFTSRRNGSADIYRVRPTGKDLQQLTDHPAFDDQAVLSPDGQRLAFVSSRSGQADIWILELTSRKLRNVTNHPGGDYRPSWSPDGQWLAFTSDRDSPGAQAKTPGSPFAPHQSTEIYIQRADGSELKRLTDSEASVGSATWSPDGKQVAFYEASAIDWRALSRHFPIPDVVPPSSQIVSLEITSGKRKLLTTGPGRKLSPQWISLDRVSYIRADTVEKADAPRRAINYWSERIQFTDGKAGPKGLFAHVSWSPDGKQMVFHRELPGKWPPLSPSFSSDAMFRLTRTGIFPSYSPDGRQLVSNTANAAIVHNSLVVMNRGGTNRRIVFDDSTRNSVAPVWSPTGDRIAFGLGGFNSFSRSRPGQVVIIGADGSGMRRVTPSNTVNYGFPSWSPDGKRLVLRYVEGMTKGLAILELESGKLSPLTSGAWNDNFPAWSPQGDLILFTSDRDGDWELYTIRTDGQELKRLTRSPGNDAHPAWSPDGRWIAFASARGGFKDEMALGVGGGQGAGDIFVMRQDGTDVRRLTDDSCEEATPTFAPR